MGAKKKEAAAVVFERVNLATDHDIWEGSLALAKLLDFMVEGTCVRADALAASLDSVGVNSERVFTGLVATGLVEIVEIELAGQKVRMLGLTRDGRLTIIHATSSL